MGMIKGYSVMKFHLLTLSLKLKKCFNRRHITTINKRGLNQFLKNIVAYACYTCKEENKTRIYTILSMSTKIISYRKRRETNASFSAIGERQHLIEQTSSEQICITTKGTS
jgi:hypothetical protein